MDEVLNSGSLRLIEADIRTEILDLYQRYRRIPSTVEHMDRDFDAYLYDTTFSTVPLDLDGPWSVGPEGQVQAQRPLANLTVENGLRLTVVNLETIVRELQLAKEDVGGLLELLPPTPI